MRGSGAQLVEYALIVVMKTIVFFTVVLIIGNSFNIDMDTVMEFNTMRKEASVKKAGISNDGVSQREINEITQIVNKALKDVAGVLK